MFIDCQQPYSHSTDTNLWSLSWIHFSGVTMQDIYQKYQERGGRPVFHPENITAFTDLHESLFTLASSDDYIRDMRINSGLNELLVLLMNESWHPTEHLNSALKKQNIDPIRDYLDKHYTEKISLDALAEQFFISKCLGAELQTLFVWPVFIWYFFDFSIVIHMIFHILSSAWYGHHKKI